MREYEIMFILRPDLADDQVEPLLTQLQQWATGAGSEVLKVEKMGRRRLAYRVEKYREGFYVIFRLRGNGEQVREFERRLKVSDTVIKYLTIRTDHEEKKLEKLRRLRARRESRRKPRAASPAAAEAV